MVWYIYPYSVYLVESMGEVLSLVCWLEYIPFSTSTALRANSFHFWCEKLWEKQATRLKKVLLDSQSCEKIFWPRGRQGNRKDGACSCIEPDGAECWPWRCYFQWEFEIQSDQTGRQPSSKPTFSICLATRARKPAHVSTPRCLATWARKPADGSSRWWHFECSRYFQ